ncbi:MAG: penicillin acylase family protein, partial [Chloroflexi bacterium]
MCGVTAEPAVAERPAAPAIAPARRPRRRPGALRVLNLLGAVVVSAAVLYAAFFPAPGLPALGPAFNPVTGGWTMAADAQVTDRSFRLAGLEQPVRVLFESDGTAHITARTDHDLFLATGYVHARFRLFQMDLMRRQGAGRLSEVVGKAALDSDRFELQLGLLKTAQLEWQQLPASDPGHDVLLAYAQGVNDRIDEARSTHTLDAMFSLLGYEPKPWTPVDSLLIKGDMTQTLNFTDTPLAMALLTKSLGADLANEWFPTLPPNQQSPYDTGPYARPAIAPIEQIPPPAEMLSGAQPLYDRMAALPAGLISRGGASNNWAVAAGKSASGGALLAGDPHLHLTLPAIWFQLSMESPGYHVAGVSIGMDFWKGDWKAYTTLSYDIPVLGGATEHLKVRWSVHGPVISQRGQTTSVYWTGNLPSQDLSVLLAIDRASDWGDFTRALRGWLSPTHNFVYADDRGNIGLISAGYYPQVAKGQPWLPMPGTGE